MFTLTNLSVSYFLPFFACWGSFLNVLGYRLVTNKNIAKPRSFCPQCKHQLAWYDNIPIVSFILLRGHCRYCSKSISWLYPFIELLTTITLSALWLLLPHHYFIAYFIFASALIVTIRSDLETMLISRFVTFFIIPIAFVASYYSYLPITFTQSIVGALFGFGILFTITKLFYILTGKHGMGQGDTELLATIGAFTGFLGAWCSLLVGSVTGSAIGMLYMLTHKKNIRTTKIPFGPFLALGALCYIFLQQHIFFELFLTK